MNREEPDSELSPEEVASGRDARLLRALKTPPQPRPKRDRGKSQPSAKPSADAESRGPSA